MDIHKYKKYIEKLIDKISTECYSLIAEKRNKKKRSV